MKGILLFFFLFAFVGTICSQEAQTCNKKKIQEILSFEKKLKSEPIGFTWKEIKKNRNWLEGHSSPLMFKRMGSDKIDLIVEYYLNSGKTECTSVISNWDNALLRSLSDTAFTLNEFKEVYKRLGFQFGLDTSKMFFENIYDDFEKATYIDTIEKFLYNNQLFTLELLYLYSTPEQRRIRLYYSPNNVLK